MYLSLQYMGLSLVLALGVITKSILKVHQVVMVTSSYLLLGSWRK